jgi:aryl-alcohol dehydrogenase-like predicted oxidoreductase
MSSEFSRRHVLQAGAVTGATLAFAPLWAAPTEGLPLITKPIPSTGQHLPAVGIGTDAFSNAPIDELRGVLRRMGELGGSVIDTAAAYGDSEARIGEILAQFGTREHMFLATKLVGGGLSGLFSRTGAASFERSLQRLRTSRVELLQVHNLSGVDELMPLMQDWKKAGRIRYIGVTTSRGGQHADIVAAMRKYPLDFIQVDYSIANRDAAAMVLPLAQERRVAVLANLPLGRASLIRQVVGRQLPPWAAEIDVKSWGQFLLKYVISHPAVTCAIPGSTKLVHLEDNQAAGHGRLPDAALRKRMEEYWSALR